jgi:sugar lactone lactonase YvrE
VQSFSIQATDTVTGATATQSYQPTIYAAPATAASVAFASAQTTSAWGTTTATVTFNFHGSSIVNGFAVVTDGVPNLEFKWAHSGTCTVTEYNDGDSCTLDLLFNPLDPGQRVGAVELLDSNGNILGTALLSGTGTAALASFAPGSETTLASAQSRIPLQAPAGVAIDASGNTFVADSAAHTVLKVTPGGTVTKVVDLTALSGNPVAVALDGAGNLYLTDEANKTLWRQTPPYTGTPVALVSETINPPAAGLASLSGLAVDATGNLFFTAPAANLVYQMSLAPATGFAVPAAISTASSLKNPAAVAIDASGNLYIADTGNNRVVIEPAGGSTSSSQETLISTGLNAPASVAVDGNGNVYIANTGSATVLKSVLSGTSYATPVVVQTAAMLQSVTGVALDGRGNLILSDATAKTLFKEDFNLPRPFAFTKKTIVNTTDTIDGVIRYTFSNAGNATLTAVSPGLNAATDFPLIAGSGTPADCTSNFGLASNAACNLSFQFQPTTTGSFAESIVLTDNSMASSSASQSIQLTGTGLPVLQLTWDTPTAIPYGTPLNATQLDASAGVVDGSFVYTPAAGTVLDAGSQTLSVTFTPTDSTDYIPATTTVPLTVTQVTTTTTLASSINPSLGGSEVTFTATVTPITGVATGSVNFLDGSVSLGTATLTSGVATLATTLLSAGAHSITAVYAGDTNCIPSSSAAIAQVVVDFSVDTTDANNSNTQPVSPNGSAVYTLAIAPTAGTSFPAPTTLTVSGLPLLATVTLSGSGWVQKSSLTWSLPANTPLSNLNLTIQLHANVENSRTQPALWRTGAAPLLLGLLLLPFAAQLRRHGKRLNKILPLLFFACVAAATLLLDGCAANLLMPPQTYNILVTVQSGTLTRSTTIKLNVQ